jgi:hypothetical protein
VLLLTSDPPICLLAPRAWLTSGRGGSLTVSDSDDKTLTELEAEAKRLAEQPESWWRFALTTCQDKLGPDPALLERRIKELVAEKTAAEKQAAEQQRRQQAERSAQREQRRQSAAKRRTHKKYALFHDMAKKPAEQRALDLLSWSKQFGEPLDVLQAEYDEFIGAARDRSCHLQD